MNIFFYLKLYLVTLVVFLGLDSVWLIKIAPNFYKTHIGHLMATPPKLLPAAIFYLLNVIGLLVFVLTPALRQDSLAKALVLGAFYGLFTYATYDLTNLATLKDWPLVVTLVDILWGTILSATVSAITFLIAKHLV